MEKEKKVPPPDKTPELYQKIGKKLQKQNNPAKYFFTQEERKREIEKVIKDILEESQKQNE